MPKVYIPRAYYKYTNNEAMHESGETKLTSLFHELIRNYPALVSTVFSSDAIPMPFVRIAVQNNILSKEDYSSRIVSAADDILIINAVAGG